MSTLFITALTALYLGVLFAVAWRGDRAAPGRWRPAIYALSLGIYCTSWTYFGAVGTASRRGWDYLPIYLGPALAILIGYPLWRRILVASKRERIGSIADFLAARYSKSRGLGALVTTVLLISALPYLALQLNALSQVLTRLSTNPGGSNATAVCLISAALAVFAILFGARRPDLTEHNHGLVRAIALESLVKLIGILAIAGVAIFLLATRGAPGAWTAAVAPHLAEPPSTGRFIVLTALSAAAILCLPRQFHMGFVEAQDTRELEAARRLLPLYLLAFSLAVPPIVAAGQLFLHGHSSADLFVTDLSLAFAPQALAALVLIGGISAATAMVIVEAVALSAMISNHLVLPLTRGWLIDPRSGDVGGVLVAVRRLAIVGVLTLATLYFFAARDRGDLASAGLIAFAGAAQLAPALIGAVTWRRAHVLGALGGVSVGFAVWVYALFIPELAPHVPVLSYLPQPALGPDPLVAASVLSLGLNLLVFVAGSLVARPRMLAQLQAAAFVGEPAPRRLNRTAADLKTIVAKFLGEEGAARAFAAFEAEHGRHVRSTDPVDPVLARGAELMLAGALGASSARAVLARTLSDHPRDADQVVRFLDEAAEVVQFNRELLQATLDNLTEGVSVVDAELRLVAWNAAYLQLFDLPPHLVHVGRPIADIYRFNAIGGEIEAQDVEAMVERRLANLRKRQRHVYERVRRNGRILRSSGAPMPGGGYVTSYTDVTDLRRTADALQAANEQLEERVEQRTRELAQAKADAEAATESKTHFLAAASHDLLQPLHAARLFLGALADDLADAPATQRDLVASADRAISAANGMLKALLNLSRLEAGGVTPSLTTVEVAPLLEDLRREFAPMAAARGLALIVSQSSLAVVSDHDLLRSMLQNLITNAVRYTGRGKVLVGARRCGDQVRFEVRDTGRGIPEESRERIFKEFERLDDSAGGEGAGLGLAIVERIARLLRHRIGVRSAVGRGSTFWIEAPRARASRSVAPRTAPAPAPGSLAGLRVLCVDNEPEILAALGALLSRWEVEPVLAGSYAEALRLAGRFDAALVDQQLTDGEGLALVDAMGDRLGRIALITASTSDAVLEAARLRKLPLIRKPVRPAAIRAFLNAARTSATTPAET